jgi:hypothetical protein
MEILRSINLYTELRNMPFVVIGGHAVNNYGMARNTADLDLVVPLADQGKWLILMEKLKYEAGQSDDRFARFRPKGLDNWPIDLMFVNDETFSRLREDSVTACFGEVEAPIASIEHLILMKLHAMKYFQEHRFAKDYADLIGLIRVGKIEVEGKCFSQWCAKYATEDLYQRILRDLKGE